MRFQEMRNILTLKTNKKNILSGIFDSARKRIKLKDWAQQSLDNITERQVNSLTNLFMWNTMVLQIL